MAALTAGQQQGAGEGNAGWLALPEDVKLFQPAAITHKFLEKLLKWQADVGGGVNKVCHV